MRLALYFIATTFSIFVHATLPLWPLPRHVVSGSSRLWMTPEVKFAYRNDRNLQNLVGWLWDNVQSPNLFVHLTGEEPDSNLTRDAVKIQLTADKLLLRKSI